MTELFQGVAILNCDYIFLNFILNNETEAIDGLNYFHTFSKPISDHMHMHSDRVSKMTSLLKHVILA